MVFLRRWRRLPPVRQMPVRPAGIEAGPLAALVSAGAGRAPPAAAVPGYRLFSRALIIPAGMITWAQPRRRSPGGMSPAR
ncbi:hypothetical protein J2S43_003127 [Catenuloplanes nepalensis]|uniref:Uncharacterized protein n=1 Tax=Catenuloplanes nepalensis TaxID=587533 RepID=A0ABT9MT47_9ACTN|nr:hypothetical protein [Catenuloplanes nepalensis]MDP9794615.1 hypothetical protein [Catenuloplanes nepalensis]